MLNIMGVGTIEISDEISETELKKLATEIRKGLNVYKVEVQLEHNVINFEMSGNHCIDYSVLNNVKEKLLDEGVSFNIMVTEFLEGENGYYFDSEEYTDE